MKYHIYKLVLIITMFTITLYSQCVFAKTPEKTTPMNIAINSRSNNLILGSGGKLTCSASTTVASGYKAVVIVELQQENKGWRTIKTWSDQGGTLAKVNEDWYVEKGYSYRLKLTHKALSSTGNEVESFLDYSKIVTYN